MVRNLPSFVVVLLSVVLLAACGSTSEKDAEFTTLSTTVDLEPDWARRGETVTARLTGANTKEVTVTVGNAMAHVTVISGHEFEFQVPGEVDAGLQPVTIDLSAQTLLSRMHVLGDDVAADEFVLIVAPGTSLAELAGLLDGLDYTVLEGPRLLGSKESVCSGALVRISIGGLATGEALDELKDRTDGDTLWHSDPQSGYSSGTVDHLDAVGAHESRLRGLSGAGTLISVLDTGVSAHAELGSRLLLDQGYDFVDEGTPATDAFGEDGHGTPIAVLTAGTTSGVAPQAEVLPVRVCDENGLCYTSDVMLGICHAIAVSELRAAGLGNSVLNLSLGGETPVTSIRAALEFAASNGVLAAAAGGNEREQGSPPHYPAAHDIDGVLAVAALEATSTGELLDDWRPASFSTRGEYLDLSAPGVELTSGTSSGGYGSTFTGTSYSTALVAGGLAVWREARPSLSAPEIEARIEEAAKPLPYLQDRVGAGMLDLSSQPR